MLKLEAPSINSATRPGSEVTAMSGFRNPPSDEAAIECLIPKPCRAALISSYTCTHTHTTCVAAMLCGVSRKGEHCCFIMAETTTFKPGIKAYTVAVMGRELQNMYLGCSSAGPVLPSCFGLLQHCRWQKWGSLLCTSSRAPVQCHVGLEDLLEGVDIQL